MNNNEHRTSTNNVLYIIITKTGNQIKQRQIKSSLKTLVQQLFLKNTQQDGIYLTRNAQFFSDW